MKISRFIYRKCWLSIHEKEILTFGWAAGYEYNFTLPKSSPETSSFLSWDTSQALTSVPSAPSGQMPTVWNVIVQELLAQEISRIWVLWVIWRQTPGFPVKNNIKIEIDSWMFSNYKKNKKTWRRSRSHTLISTLIEFLLDKLNAEGFSRMKFSSQKQWNPNGEHTYFHSIIFLIFTRNSIYSS